VRSEYTFSRLRCVQTCAVKVQKFFACRLKIEYYTVTSSYTARVVRLATPCNPFDVIPPRHQPTTEKLTHGTHTPTFVYAVSNTHFVCCLRFVLATNLRFSRFLQYRGRLYIIIFHFRRLLLNLSVF